MNNLSFKEVEILSMKEPKKALRVHFSHSEEEPTQYFADQVIPAMLEEAKSMVEDGQYGVPTVEEAMKKLGEITYICTEEDYQAEQADRDE
jgi:hypothetical protein